MSRRCEERGSGEDLKYWYHSFEVEFDHRSKNARVFMLFLG